MTPREQAAFNAGIRAAREAATIAARAIGARPGPPTLRDRAAVEALCGLADGLDTLALGAMADPLADALAAIAADPNGFGEIPCPTCAGRLLWTRDHSNGHLHARCETPGCLAVMQ